MDVQVYWNIPKKCFSIRSKGKVVDHRSFLIMKDCEYHVNENGRKKVIETKRKNVHAYIKGTLLEESSSEYLQIATEALFHKSFIEYNPYVHTKFKNKKTGSTVEKSKWCICMVISGDKPRVMKEI